MLAISLSSIFRLSSYFLNIKAPATGGKRSRYLFRGAYPRRRSRFLFTALLETLFGAIKEIFAVLLFINLKLRLGELTLRPFLKICSIVFLSARLFFGVILNREPGSAFAPSPCENFPPGLAFGPDQKPVGFGSLSFFRLICLRHGLILLYYPQIINTVSKFCEVS